MDRLFKKTTWIWLSGLLALLLAGCSSPYPTATPLGVDAGPSSPLAESPIGTPSPAIIVTDQELGQGRVTIAEVVSDGPGRIEESIDAGENWQPVMDGLDPVWPKHMVQRFVQARDELLAVLSNGEVIAAPLSSLAWRQVLPPVQGAQAIAVTTE